MSKKLRPFKFKQFSLQHEKSAMKIGADGLLLGALAKHKAPSNILDIGTGCGLIALMLQQKFRKAKITALEPNKLAFDEASDNFQNAPFAQNPLAILSTLQNFNPGEYFDLIVSNPPFFSDSVSSGNKDRDMARQANFLPLQTLIEKSASLLATNGNFVIVYPMQHLGQIIAISLTYKLYVSEIITIVPNSTSPAKRVIITLGRNKLEPVERTIQIETSRNCYTPEYVAITKDYHLNF